MKWTCVVLALFASVTGNLSAVPQQINYQGQLSSSAGIPVDTTISIGFVIFNGPNFGATPLWSETQSAVTVQNGLFHVILGSVNSFAASLFDSPDLWLGIAVGSDGEMSPRVRIVSDSYAQRVHAINGALGGAIVGDLDVLGDLRGDTLSVDNTIRFSDGTFQGSAFDSISLSNRINLKADSADHATRTWIRSMGYLKGANNTATAGFGVVGGGDNNKARGSYSVIGGGGGNAAADSNSARGSNSTISGGRGNSTENFGSTVGGGSANFAQGTYSTISGGLGNSATLFYATIGGGSSNTANGNGGPTVSGGFHNSATGQSSAVGGGSYGGARGDWSVVAGGGGSAADDSNSARGEASAIMGGRQNEAIYPYSFVGGGINNVANDTAVTISGGRNNGSSGQYSTIGGGDDNAANGNWATVSGGFDNSASSSYSTVPGGYNNISSGQYSFAAGRFARASNTGSFVWSSGGDSTLSWGVNTFTVRSPGGVRFYTDATAVNIGVSLATGSGTWASLSDSSTKRRHGRVNGTDVLDRVMQLPIERWTYKTQHDSIQHIGPMAQDFHRLFHVGDNNTTISTVDPDGIALAAIQELAKQNAEMRSEIAVLRAQVQSMSASNQQSESIIRR